MSSSTEQYLETLRAEFIKALVVALKRLRIASEAQDRHTLFGIALGLIGQAQRFQLISWEEHLRLHDLASNASSYASRETAARSGVTP